MLLISVGDASISSHNIKNIRADIESAPTIIQFILLYYKFRFIEQMVNVILLQTSDLDIQNPNEVNHEQ